MAATYNEQGFNEHFNSEGKYFKTDMTRLIERGNRDLQEMMQRYGGGLADLRAVLTIAKTLQEYEKYQYGTAKTNLKEVTREALQYNHT